MKTAHILTFGSLAILLAACESGDINIAPTTSVSNSNNTTGGGAGPNDLCAAYVNSGGQTLRGLYDGQNCTYPPSFLDSGNNLLVDMTIPDLPNDGAHIFQGSLFVGRNYTTTADATANGITQGGDGPTLTVEAGATVAFQSSSTFMIINRGSQLFAVGTADNPITFTSVSDVNGTVGPEDVQQWGGMVINGFAVTNKCAYTGTRGQAGFAQVGNCSVEAEGAAGLDESHYGGDNDADSSGRLEYVVVKHTGATVGSGDELNGISFGGVGSNTIIRNIEMYSTYDDGVEMFGGSVNIENYVAVYVRDDSIDIDEGYSGTFTNALVIQSETDGNQCIESDGIGDYSGLTDIERADLIARNLNSRPTINNLTCIISPNGAATATHDPGAGWRFREGIFPTINNGLMVGSFSANDQTAANDNFCLRIESPETQQGALDGNLNLNSVIFACAEFRNETFPDGTTTTQTFAEGEGNLFAAIPNDTAVSATAVSNPELQLLQGTPPIYSIDYATSMVDGAIPGAGSMPVPIGGEASRTFLGALSLGSTDWTAQWTYGIHAGNRAQPLWFEAL